MFKILMVLSTALSCSSAFAEQKTKSKIDRVLLKNPYTCANLQPVTSFEPQDHVSYTMQFTVTECIIKLNTTYKDVWGLFNDELIQANSIVDVAPEIKVKTSLTREGEAVNGPSSLSVESDDPIVNIAVAAANIGLDKLNENERNIAESQAKESALAACNGAISKIKAETNATLVRYTQSKELRNAILEKCFPGIGDPF